MRGQGGAAGRPGPSSLFFIPRLVISYHENSSTIFTARRVCIARTTQWQDVCPSVSLSVRHMPVLCVNGYTDPQKFTSGTPHSSLFVPNGMEYSDGDSLTGASNATAV